MLQLCKLGLYYKTLRICKSWKFDSFRNKLVSSIASRKLIRAQCYKTVLSLIYVFQT
jgi:hypothetical protein